MGVSPRRLSGWEPAEVTEYHYDGDRLVGSTTRREPEWGDADRVAVLAELERRRLTGSHGQPLDEAMSPLADPSSWEAQWGYAASPNMDYAAQALERAQDDYRKKYGDVPHGLKWSVRKVPRV